jgi:hypothetical protein
MKVNPLKLHRDLGDAGLPVTSVDETGRVIYLRGLNDEEQRRAEQIIMAHDPSPDKRQRSREQDRQAGICDRDLLEALWEWVVSGRHENVEEILARRER